MLDILEIPKIRKSVLPISLKNYEELCKIDPEYYKNTEFFRGMVIDKMTKSSEHNYYKNVFTEAIHKLLPSQYFLQNENSIYINQDLEPEISVIKGSHKDFKHNKPITARFVVEVSISSLVYDRNKAQDYAIANWKNIGL